jgi:hypothetical protein
MNHTLVAQFQLKHIKPVYIVCVQVSKCVCVCVCLEVVGTIDTHRARITDTNRVVSQSR